jgi:hypothetical protein
LRASGFNKVVTLSGGLQIGYPHPPARGSRMAFSSAFSGRTMASVCCYVVV